MMATSISCYSEAFLTIFLKNQARLIKILNRQNLRGSFKTREDESVQLEIYWGSETL